MKPQFPFTLSSYYGSFHTNFSQKLSNCHKTKRSYFSLCTVGVSTSVVWLEALVTFYFSLKILILF